MIAGFDFRSSSCSLVLILDLPRAMESSRCAIRLRFFLSLRMRLLIRVRTGPVAVPDAIPGIRSCCVKNGEDKIEAAARLRVMTPSTTASQPFSFLFQSRTFELQGLRVTHFLTFSILSHTSSLLQADTHRKLFPSCSRKLFPPCSSEAISIVAPGVSTPPPTEVSLYPVKRVELAWFLTWKEEATLPDLQVWWIWLVRIWSFSQQHKCPASNEITPKSKEVGDEFQRDRVRVAQTLGFPRIPIYSLQVAIFVRDTKFIAFNSKTLMFVQICVSENVSTWICKI
ncbi:hypothetical protein L1887_38983 [Cichorium endivia]|nr:hypothetical protein L1887_38983 [Cichorium endivia]